MRRIFLASIFLAYAGLQSACSPTALQLTGKTSDYTSPETPADLPAGPSDEQSKAKEKERDEIIDAAKDPVGAEWKANEKIEDLIDSTELILTAGRILRAPAEADALGLKSANLSGEVWSGNTWSQYRGHTAWRYNVREVKDVSSWEQGWEILSRAGNSLYEIWTRDQEVDPFGREMNVDDLGPAEKYDLLVSDPSLDPNGVLSRAEWQRGLERYEQDGDVAHWYGYCHGWAPASLMVERPLKKVSALSFDGRREITFYPDDIKALATVLWANALPPIRLLGGRCNVKEPKRDEHGRIEDENCRDVNPGLFHMALINQLGLAKRGLLIDATFDEQIWNQPIVSYSYKYFNPQTKENSADVTAAKISREDFKRDKFKEHRNEKTVAVVGVIMEIEYTRGTTPTHRKSNSPEHDDRKKVKYSYDLELNEAGEIIGGEWYQLRHPDFMWAPIKAARAVSDFETLAEGDWDLTTPVPEAWRPAAAQAAALNQPLAKVVEGLLKASRQ